MDAGINEMSVGAAIDSVVAMSRLTYESAMRMGFREDQAMLLACTMMGNMTSTSGASMSRGRKEKKNEEQEENSDQ